MGTTSPPSPCRPDVGPASIDGAWEEREITGRGPLRADHLPARAEPEARSPRLRRNEDDPDRGRDRCRGWLVARYRTGFGADRSEEGEQSMQEGERVIAWNRAKFGRSRLRRRRPSLTAGGPSRI